MTTNELAELQKKADALGIKYKSNEGVTSLQKKIDAFEEEAANKSDEGFEDIPKARISDNNGTGIIKLEDDEDLTPEEIKAQELLSMKAYCMKLVRVTIHPTNGARTQQAGEIFRVSNSYVKDCKYVLFGSEYHITQIMYNMLKAKKVNIFIDKKVNGKDIKVAKLVNAFNIELLEPLTKAELAELATQQNARKTIEV